MHPQSTNARSLRSHKPALLACTALLAMLTSADGRQAPASELPEAELILDRHVAVTGGKLAHSRVKTRKQTGKLAVDLAGHTFVADIEEQYQTPDKSRTLIEGEFFVQLSACDGENAWEWRPAPNHGEGAADQDPGQTELLEGDLKARAIEKSRLHAALEWREHFASVRTLGISKLNGRPAYEVELETKSSERYSQFYDVENGRLVQRVRNSPTKHGEKIHLVVSIEDYREFDGLWLATRVHAKLNSPSFGKGTQTWTYSEIVHDKKLPASLFVMPEELEPKH